jgi:hypothetical protein
MILMPTDVDLFAVVLEELTMTAELTAHSNADISEE